MSFRDLLTLGILHKNGAVFIGIHATRVGHRAVFISELVISFDRLHT
jgi:hypothetical protein